MAHVVILGGGFGGLAAAHELRSLLPGDDEITVIARDDRFYMGFAKLWDLGGVRSLAEGTRSLHKLADHGARYVQADITAVDAAARRVETSAGTFEADALLVALGAGPSPKHRQMLEADGAYDLYDGEACDEMRAGLDALDGGRIVISILGGPFKCPPAPYEAALLIDERLRGRGTRDAVEITLTTPQPIALPVAGPDASAYIASHTDRYGIERRHEQMVTGIDGDAHRVQFKDGSELDYDLFFGVPAAAPPPILRDHPLAGEDGFIHPDRHTLRTGFERVYAVGDCTTIPNAIGALPKAGVFAAGEARTAAANIAIDLHGGDLQGGEPARFDGHGFCFLELPGRQVAFVEGNFYGEPRPDVRITEASEEQYQRKLAFEAEHLDAWLG